MRLIIEYLSEVGINYLDQSKDRPRELLEVEERNNHYYEVRNFRSHSARVPIADLPRR